MMALDEKFGVAIGEERAQNIHLILSSEGEQSQAEGLISSERWGGGGGFTT